MTPLDSDARILAGKFFLWPFFFSLTSTADSGHPAEGVHVYLHNNGWIALCFVLKSCALSTN